MQKVVYLLVLMSFILVGCGSDEAAVISDILPEPDAPVLASIGNKTVTSGDTLSFTVTATDPNNLTLMMATDGTAGNAGNPYVGHGNNNADYTQNPNNTDSFDFNWNTTGVTVGNYSVEFSVMNSASLSDSETITISVLSVPDTIELGRILYQNNCLTCHGFVGQPGSRSPIGAPTPAQMEAEFIPANGSAMASFAGAFTLDERQSMHDYLCTIPENNQC